MAAVAHVYAEDTGTGFLPQPEQLIFFDESCIHLVEGRMISAVALPGDLAPAAAPPPPAPNSGTDGSGAGTPAHSRSASGAGHWRHGSSGGGAGGWGGGAPEGAPGSSPPQGGDPASGGYASDGSSGSSAASTICRAFLVSEGPNPRLIRSSADGAFTALLRSASLVEVHSHSSGRILCVASPLGRSKGAEPNLLGFFWAAAPGGELFVMVTAQGLEVYTVNAAQQALRLESTHALQSGVAWYIYSCQSRMAVLGCGSTGAKLQAFQFSKAGILRLPLLDLTPPWGSPLKPSAAAAASAGLEGFAAAREPALPRVGPDCVWVVRLYGRVYCCHHDRPRGRLRLYRLFRDASALSHDFSVFSERLELSVVDNVLLVHHLSTHVVLLLDVAAPGSNPVSAPLPLAVPVLPPPPAAAAATEFSVGSLDSEGEGEEEGLTSASAEGTEGGGGPGQQSPAQSPTAKQQLGTPQHALHAQQQQAPPPFQLHHPDWLLDACGGALYRLRLDLQAVADSESDWPRLLAFLQRRSPAVLAVRRNAQGITLRVLRGMPQERLPLGMLRRAFDAVNDAWAEAHSAPSSSSSSGNVRGGGTSSGGSKAAAAVGGSGCGDGSAGGGGGSTAAASPEAAALWRPCVGPQDFYQSVAAVLHVQQAVQPQYLLAAVLEYLASCWAHSMHSVPAALGALVVELLLEQGQEHLVGPLLRALPMLGSAELAMHLEGLDGAGRLPGGRTTALCMLSRLRAWGARCRMLVRGGEPVLAARLQRRQGVRGAPPTGELLQAAAAGRDLLQYVAVYRHCAQAAQPGLPPLKEVVRQHASCFDPGSVAALLASS